jgi:tetratricopeptide (TPR) repeat protein
MVLATARLLPIVYRKSGDPEVNAACNSALEAVSLLHKLRPSFTGRLIELYCHIRLGHVMTVLNWKSPPEPISAADCCGAGLAHLMVSMQSDESWVVELLQLKPIRERAGMDFKTPRESMERFFRTAADLDPTDYWPHHWLGWGYRVTKNYSAAVLAFDTCLALRPKYALGYTFRGQTLLQLAQEPAQGERRKELERRGLQDLEQAAALEGDEPFTHWVRANSFQAVGRPSEALQAFARAMELERPLSEWEGQFLGSEKRMLYDLAARYADEVTRTAPDNAEALSVSAAARLALGEYDLASRAAQRVLEDRADDSRALAIRGSIALDRKNFREAIRDFTKALNKSRGSHLAAAGRAKALEELGQNEDALAAYESVLKIAVTNWQWRDANLGRARILDRLGRQQEAREAREHSRRIRPAATQ